MSDIKMEEITVLVDTREPDDTWSMDPMQSLRATLYTADFSIRGMEDVVAIERKGNGLSDLLGCIGRERDRFERELLRLRAFPVSAIIVEASWADVMRGEWRGKLTPNHVAGSITAWMAKGPNFIMAGDRETSQRICRSILFHAAKYRWREAKALMNRKHQEVGDDDD